MASFAPPPISGMTTATASVGAANLDDKSKTLIGSELAAAAQGNIEQSLNAVIANSANGAGLAALGAAAARDKAGTTGISAGTIAAGIEGAARASLQAHPERFDLGFGSDDDSKAAHDAFYYPGQMDLHTTNYDAITRWASHVNGLPGGHDKVQTFLNKVGERSPDLAQYVSNHLNDGFKLPFPDLGFGQDDDSQAAKRTYLNSDHADPADYDAVVRWASSTNGQPGGHEKVQQFLSSTALNNPDLAKYVNNHLNDGFTLPDFSAANDDIPTVNGGFHQETEGYGYLKDRHGQVSPDRLQIAGSDGITYQDVKQGHHGKDCAGLSVVASIAQRDPKRLDSLIKPLTDAQGKPVTDSAGYPMYQVTLTNPEGKPWVYTTNAQFPTKDGRGSSYAPIPVATGDGKVNIGVPLLEKALVAYNDQFKTLKPDGQGYGEFAGVSDSGFSKALGGKELGYMDTSGMSFDEFAKKVNGPESKVQVTGVGHDTDNLGTKSHPYRLPSGAIFFRDNGANTYRLDGVDYAFHTGHAIAVLGAKDGVVSLYDQWQGDEVDRPQTTPMPWEDFQFLYHNLTSEAQQPLGAVAQKLPPPIPTPQPIQLPISLPISNEEKKKAGEAMRQLAA